MKLSAVNDIKKLSLPNSLKIGLLISLAAFIQIGVMPLTWPFKIKPDFLLVVSIIVAMNSSLKDFILFVLFCGFLKDLFGSYLIGFNSLMFCLDCLFIYYLLKHVNKEIPGLKFFLIVLATITNYFILTVIFRQPYILVGIIEAILNCIFAFLTQKFFLFSLCAQKKFEF